MPDVIGSHRDTTGSSHPILIVDDEPSLRDILAQILEGYDITTAPNGHEAIEILGRRRMDVVITDLMMPQVDGFAVLVTAKKANPATDVLVLTGYPSLENERKCRALGCYDILAKPFAVTAIRATVDQCMKERHTGLSV